MSDWYYSSGNDQRQGPLSTEDLIAQFRLGRIGLDTLVWRNGQPQWQPLADFAADLGLASAAGMPLPPPLPSAAVRAQRVTPLPPPKSGLSGYVIALIIVGVLAIPMVAILAAIALPAYQDYVMRAKVGGALATTEPYKAAVSSHWSRERLCPSNDSENFMAPERYASGDVASVTFGEFESEHCGIELLLTLPGNDKLDGKAVWLEYDPSDASWQCSSEIDDRYLPATCRE